MWVVQMVDVRAMEDGRWEKEKDSKKEKGREAEWKDEGEESKAQELSRRLCVIHVYSTVSHQPPAP